MASANANSSKRYYRLVWAMWVAVSLLDGAVYRHILKMDGADPRAVRLGFLFLLQAICLPIYFSRITFERAAETVIRSAAAAMTFAGMASFFLGAIARLLGIPVLTSKDPRLQFGYVSSVLLLNAITGGIVLGLFRWRIVREQPKQPGPLSFDIELDRKLRSVAIWIGCAALSFWLLHAYEWATADLPLTTSLTTPESLLPGAARYSDFLGRLPGAAGLFLISPIPFLLPPREGRSLGRQILKYSALAFAAGFGASAIASLHMLLWAPLVFPYIFPSFCLPALLWGVLYGASLQPSSKSAPHSESRYSPYYPLPSRLLLSGPVWLSTAGYAFALLAGWLATTPVALGVRGAGCLSVFQIGAAEYSFWKAYKGFAVELNTGDRMLVRLSADRSTCMTLDPVSINRLSTPAARSGGYVVAARVWSWLIDPEEWQSDRTMLMRMELKRLLGQDFSSYDELQAWWERNGEYLGWSGSGDRLEVHDPNSQSGTDQAFSPRRETYVRASTSQSVREAPWLFGPDPLTGYPSLAGFGSLFFDPEARLHALKLYAADNIQILTGERERRVREYLRNLTGEDFVTERQWSDYISKLPPSPCIHGGCPWNLTELDRRRWRTSPDSVLWDAKLQPTPGERPDDFVPWILRPESGYYAQWAKARDLDFEANEERRRSAVSWLQSATGQIFHSPETWVRWWQENRSNLVLSEDGLTLVVKRR